MCQHWARGSCLCLVLDNKPARRLQTFSHFCQTSSISGWCEKTLPSRAVTRSCCCRDPSRLYLCPCPSASQRDIHLNHPHPPLAPWEHPHRTQGGGGRQGEAGGESDADRKRRVGNMWVTKERETWEERGRRWDISLCLLGQNLHFNPAMTNSEVSLISLLSTTPSLFHCNSNTTNKSSHLKNRRRLSVPVCLLMIPSQLCVWLTLFTAVSLKTTKQTEEMNLKHILIKNTFHCMNTMNTNGTNKIQITLWVSTGGRLGNKPFSVIKESKDRSCSQCVIHECGEEWMDYWVRWDCGSIIPQQRWGESQLILLRIHRQKPVKVVWSLRADCFCRSLNNKDPYGSMVSCWVRQKTKTLRTQE